MNWLNIWRAARRAECVRRLYRDERAQAMTEAAIVMPVVVLVFIAAHEFMWMNEFKYLVGRASRMVVWHASDFHNYSDVFPDHTDDPATHADVLKARGTEQYTAAAEDAFKLLFEGKLGVAGHGFTETDTTDEYAFHKSFTFSTDIASGGGSESEVEGNMGAGDPGSGSGFGSMFSSIADIFGTIAGEAVTGVSVPGVGFLRFGPELPTRGQAQGGFTVAWQPMFHALITSADGTPGGGSGDSTHSFFGSAEAKARYESEVLQAYNGLDGVVPIGMTGDAATDPGRVYGRFALLTHDYRPIDNDDDASFHWHVKGWTLLGALSGSYGGASTSGGGFASDVVAFLDEAFFPFKCCLRTDRIGQEDEDTEHLTEDFPTFN